MDDARTELQQALDRTIIDVKEQLERHDAAMEARVEISDNVKALVSDLETAFPGRRDLIIEALEGERQRLAAAIVAEGRLARVHR